MIDFYGWRGISPSRTAILMWTRDIMQPPAGAEVTEADSTIKPEGSLDAEEWRKRSKRRARAQQQARDEDARHVAKQRDLKARLP
jgi:hypothetical protein